MTGEGGIDLGPWSSASSDEICFIRWSHSPEREIWPASGEPFILFSASSSLKSSNDDVSSSFQSRRSVVSLSSALLGLPGGFHKDRRSQLHSCEVE